MNLINGDPFNILYLVTPQCTHVLEEYEPDKYSNRGYLNNTDFFHLTSEYYQKLQKTIPSESFILPPNCFYHKYHPNTNMHDFGIFIPSQTREIQYFNGVLTKFYNLIFPKLVVLIRVGEFKIGSEKRYKVYHKNTHIGFLNTSNIQLDTTINFLPLNNIHCRADEVQGTICWGDAVFDYQKQGVNSLSQYVVGLIEHFFLQPFNPELGMWHLGFKELQKYISDQQMLMKSGDIHKLTLPSQIMNQEKFYEAWGNQKTEEAAYKYLYNHAPNRLSLNDLINKFNGG